jgi:hypothetical protein
MRERLYRAATIGDFAPPILESGIHALIFVAVDSCVAIATIQLLYVFCRCFACQPGCGAGGLCSYADRLIGCYGSYAFFT